MTRHTSAPRSRSLQRILDLSRETAFLSVDAERILVRESASGDKSARERLVRAHFPLLVSLAREYSRYGVPLDDLIGEGVLGLMRAVSLFDAARGVRFSTYASLWIRAFVRRYTLANRTIVRAPSTRGGRKAVAQLTTAERAFRHMHGTEPSILELAEMLGVQPTEVQAAMGVLRNRDVTLTPERGAIDIVSGDPSAEERYIDEESNRNAVHAIGKALGLLDSRELLIARKRLLTEEAEPLTKVGARLGISHERVRQLEARACGKLRRALTETYARVA